MAVNWLPFLGCLSISFGPTVILFILTCAREAQAVILFITSAFFWLLSLLLTSLVWLAVVPLRSYLGFTLIFSVIFQEILRGAFYVVVKQTNIALSRISRETTDMFSGSRYALVAGLGYGTMSAMFMYVNVLAAASGPATYYVPGNPSMPIFISGALQASAMTGLHVCWGLLCSEAVEKKHLPSFLIVFVSHLVVSSLTIMNEQGIFPVYAITAAYLMLAVIGSYTFKRFQGKLKPLFKIL